MKHTPRRNKLFMITGVIAAGIVAVAGCSSSNASTSANSKPGRVTLVVYSAQGYDHAMTAAFTKATGIPAKLDDNSSGPLLTGAHRAAPGPARLPPVQRRAAGGGPAGLSQPRSGDGQAMNGAGYARSRPSLLATVSHLGPDHA